jgi:Dyp-type peroxidase family
MTVLSPVRPWLLPWVKFLFFVGEHVDVLFKRRIRELSFIHCARWSLVGKALPPRTAPGRQRLHQRHLLFESNFNGRWDEYLDAFALTMKLPLKLIWGTSYGFPGPQPTEPFRDCIRRNDFRADYYYSAYPEASTSMVMSALALSADVTDLAAQVDTIGAAAFQVEFNHLLTRWQGGLGEPPRWVRPRRIGPVVWDPLRQSEALTVLAPICRDRLFELQRTLADLSSREEKKPFNEVGGTHFARWVVIDELVYEAFGQKPDHLRDPLLLFAANVDGPLDAYLHTLRTSIPEVVDSVWGTCHDYPGSRDAQGFARFIEDRRITPAIRWAAYPGATVEDVRSSLELERRLVDFAAAAQWMPAERLLDEFGRTFRFKELPVGARSRRPHDAARWARTGPAGWSALAAWTRARCRQLAPGVPRHGWWNRQARRTRPPKLENLQGLVRGYGRRLRAAEFVFVHIRDDGAARRWLAEIARDVTTCRGWTRSTPVAATNVAFTFSGLRRLGVPESSLATFPTAFKEGMASRAGSVLGDAGENAPAHWERPFRRRHDDAVTAGEEDCGDGGVIPEKEIHVLVALYAEDGERLRIHSQDVRQRMATGGVDVLRCHHGARLPGDREHFGFVDGVSQPEVEGISRPRRGQGRRRRTARNRPIATGEFLLGHPNEDGLLPDAPAPSFLAQDGTYLVYRKIEQHVEAFQQFLDDEAAAGGRDRGWLAAKVLGRSLHEGVPLDKDAEPDEGLLRPHPDAASDDFDYEGDPAGLRCPLGAHIRRANPRAGLPAGDDLVRRHRLLRRGIPYVKTRPAAAGEDVERGLLFLALMGDIEGQFEFVQREWLNDGNIFKLGVDRDVIAGTCAGDGRIVIQGDPPCVIASVPRLTTVRGGEYFFLPGMDALRGLAEGWADEGPSPRRRRSRPRDVHRGHVSGWTSDATVSAFTADGGER